VFAEGQKGDVARRRVVIACAAALTVGGTIFGGAAVLRYEATPGTSAAPPPDWPPTSRIERRAGAAQIVFFAHPKCPCTRASFAELEAALRLADAPTDVVFVFHRPKDAGADWERDATIEARRRFPNARVFVDVGGEEAKLFGAETSGHALLFDADGRNLFSGGVTGARDHIGDNVGRRALVEALRSPPIEPVRRVVFGCPLFEPEAAEGPDVGGDGR
jgi:hypothetical protein